MLLVCAVFDFELTASSFKGDQITARDENVKLTPIGVKEVEPAVFSFVVEWLYEYRGRDFISKHCESEHSLILVYCKLRMFAFEQKMAELHDAAR